MNYHLSIAFFKQFNQLSTLANYQFEINKMARSQWVYASGSQWVRFDSTSSHEIEKMFFKGGAGWVHVRAFGGQVYVNATSGYVCSNSGLRFTIARLLV